LERAHPVEDDVSASAHLVGREVVSPWFVVRELATWHNAAMDGHRKERQVAGTKAFVNHRDEVLAAESGPPLH
jgi:hypothetical protein